MRLFDFIQLNHARIGQSWDEFASRLTSFAQGLNLPSLRDDLDALLDAICQDIGRQEISQSDEKKERGMAPGAVERLAAKHAQMRLSQGFNLRHVAAEYRALRASILDLYLNSEDADPEMGDVLRFDDAIDQAIAEILKHYEKSITQYRRAFWLFW